ncbi:MAG: BatA domain-containing protein [Gemmataceae bacterium]
MSFVHPLLLGGLIFLAVPVLLHLIMRQQPKHLLFPAMRFLMQRHRTNQRKLQLRHLLLLALRLLLLAAICLALARPKLFSERLNLTGKRPVAAVLLFDTSPSMEYRQGEDSRLDDARRRGLELLDDLPENSRVAVLDTNLGGDWLPNIAEARKRIADLKVQPESGPLTSQFRLVYELLDKVNAGNDNQDAVLLPFVYVFSDRMQGCWSTNQLDNLLRRQEQLSIPAHAAFVDVGVEKMEDVAIINLTMGPALGGGNRVRFQATLRARGRAHDVEVICLIDGERIGHSARKIEPDTPETFDFESGDLAPGLHQVETRIVSNLTPLPLRYARYHTFEIQGKRRVLVVADDPREARFWTAALESGGGRAFQVETIASRDLAGQDWKELAAYRAIALFNVKDLDEQSWRALKSYVEAGGGLAFLPGGDMKFSQGAADLLPAPYLESTLVEKGVGWRSFGGQHPVMAQFREWSMQPSTDFVKFPRSVYRFWKVGPTAGKSSVLVAYADDARSPALLERTLGRGRVLQFTTTFDDRTPAWNNYLQTVTSFYPVLAHVTTGYLTGSADLNELNHLSGQAVTIPLPSSPRLPKYLLQGPGIEGTDQVLVRGENDDALRITRAVEPGNFQLLQEDLKPIAGFSLNVPGDEFLYARVPVEDIEALLGKDAVLSVDYKDNLEQALGQRWKQPVELFPWLMMLILIVLAVENLLSNRFYRKLPDAPEASTIPSEATQEQAAAPV